ncbi:MAG: hypothetical protein WCA20_29575 [Candidatus Sulfotelmatobacter sp.]
MSTLNALSKRLVGMMLPAKGTGFAERTQGVPLTPVPATHGS